MKPIKNYQVKDNSQSSKYCKNGYMCPNLSRKCTFKHDIHLDRQRYDAFQDISQRNSTVIILNTLLPKPEPMCLFCDILPIKFIFSKEEMNALKPGVYYQAKYIEINKDNEVVVRFHKQMGSFGDINLQLEIMKQYCKKQYRLDQSKQKPQFGKIDVNWEYVKVMKGTNFKKYFNKVNQGDNYPFFYNCQVRYLKPEGNSKYNIPKILSINYPKKKISGVLQIDPKGLFYLMCRNMKIDDLSPYEIPQGLIEQVKALKTILPYSMLKKYEISEKLQKQINKDLKNFILKGQFHSWPLQSRYPLVTLTPQFSTINYKSLKQAIIFQSCVVSNQFSQKQQREAKRIKQKFKIGSYKNRSQWKDPVFTMDGKGTKCHDDAFSIIKSGDNIKISVHIADVAQIIHEADLIDLQMQKRDQTIYIKGFFMPLLMKQLIQITSLRAGNKKLSHTLSFELNKDGLIDFETVIFEDTIIEVNKNFYHQQKLENTQELQDFFQFGRYIQKAKLIDQSYFVEQQTRSQIIMSQLIHLSAMIPTAMLKFNEKRIAQYKQTLDQYINQTLNKNKQKIQEWDKTRKQIKALQKECQQIKSQQSKVQFMIKKQIEKQSKKLRAQLIKQQANKKQSTKRQRGEKSLADRSSSEQQFSEEENLDKNEIDGIVINDADNFEQKIEEEQKKQAQKQKDRKQKMKKLLQKKTGKLQESSDSQDLSDDEQIFSEQEEQIMKLKKQAAQGGWKYIEKIFRFYQISMEWYQLSDIKKSFSQLYKKNKSELFQKYIKRAQVMNKQHFRYWLKDRSRKYEEKKGQNQKKNNKVYKIKHQQEKIIQPNNKIEQKQQNIDKPKKISRHQEKKQQSKEIELNSKKSRRSQKINNKKKTQYKIKDQHIEPKAKIEEPTSTELDSKQQSLIQNTRLESHNMKKRRKSSQIKQTNVQPPHIYQNLKNQQVSIISVDKITKQSLKNIAINNACIFFQKYYDSKKYLDIQAIKQLPQNSIFDSAQEKGLMENIEKDLRQQYYHEKLNQIINLQLNKPVFSQKQVRQCRKQISMEIRLIQEKILADEESNNKFEELNLTSINYEAVLKSLNKNCWKIYNKLQETQQNEKQGQKFEKSQVETKYQYLDWISQQQMEGMNPRQKYYYGKMKMINIAKIISNRQEQLQKIVDKQINRNRKYYLSILELQEIPEKMEMLNNDQTQDLNKSSLQKFQSIKIKILKNIKKDLTRMLQRKKGPINNKAENTISKIWKELIKQDSLVLSISPEFQVKINSLSDDSQRKVLKEQQINIKVNEICQKFSNCQHKQEQIGSFLQFAYYECLKKQIIKSRLIHARKQKFQKKKVVQKQEKVKQLNQSAKKDIKEDKQAFNNQSQGQDKKQLGKQVKIQIKKQQLKKKNTKEINNNNNNQYQKKKISSQSQILPAQNQLINSENPKQQPKNEQKAKKLTKKGLKKIVQSKMVAYKAQLEEKYNYKTLKEGTIEKTKGFKAKISEISESMKQKVKQIENQYNFLEYVVELYDKMHKSPKKSKKTKRAKKEQQDGTNQTIQSIRDILDILWDYSQIFSYKLKKFKVSEIQQYVEQQLPMQALIDKKQQTQDFISMNKNFSDLLTKQSDLDILKWNNPIRSYAALKTLRLVKRYAWMLNSKISAFDVLLNQKEIKSLKEELKKIKDFKNSKEQLGQVKKNYQEANREIDKLDFYYFIKKNKQNVYTFLNIGSPCENQVKFVFHETLGELQIKNKEFKQKMYEQVKGRVKILSEFPVELQVVLIG